MNNNNIHIVGISGSLRKGSYNTALLNAAKELLPEGMTMEIASIADIPLYNGDLDLPAVKERPANVVLFRDILAKADAVLFVSPEYNYSIPGGLKNAIDWASRGEDSPLLNKPAALMGVTPGMWGTIRMQVAFKPVFQFLNMTGLNKPEILVAKAKEKFDETGKLTDTTTRDLVIKQLEALKNLILRIKKG